jgi:Cdc6-like AAA superfamily ATPase
MSYFLGANTPYGFYSLFNELYNPDSDDKIYLIKGGPGTGKSSIMKRVASEAEKNGYDVLVYMKENDIEVKHINIHSDHAVGAPKMREYVWEHFPGVSLISNPLNY